jgi:hypothetical protein
MGGNPLILGLLLVGIVVALSAAMTRKKLTSLISPLAMLAMLPLLGGAKGDGCAANSKSPAPDVTGTWQIEYDDVLDVEITIGGAVYTRELGAQGGAFTITHNGQPLSFDLDCSRPEVLCPSEAWPTTVRAEQRNTQFEHRMIVTLPTQTCSGQIVAADPSECGAGTNNPDCEDVCEGTIVHRDAERFGVIGESGDTFRLYLGAGIATNGFNCALLGVSVADADLVNSGSPEDGTWRATAMDSGLVTTAYAGGCLWAGDPDMDGELEALVIGASVKLTTGFTGTKRAF